MNSQDTEHYVNSVCSVIGTMALCYFYWSHLPPTRQEELRQWGRRLWTDVRFQLREQRITKNSRDWLEALWRRPVANTMKEESHGCISHQ
ncbi:MAG TPA: hypothetical protein VKU60_19910 [Chloroflexota bacterium]|nr:hypothetical protein [Chloroflexota bacterium]